MWISRRELARILKESKRWRRRSEDLERELTEERTRHSTECAELRSKLESELATERTRNRDREERLVDRVLTSKASYPVTDPPKRSKGTSSTDPPLTAIEEAELEMYKASAVENGYGAEIGRRLWEKKRKGEELDWDEFSHLDEITT